MKLEVLVKKSGHPLHRRFIRYDTRA
jgi:hypothetical protein